MASPLLTVPVMMKHALALALVLAGCAAEQSLPADGGAGGGGKADGASEPDAATRAKILAAIHADTVAPAVNGQAAEIQVDSIRVAGDFAWVTGTVGAEGGGEIDWTNSTYADEIAEGFWDGPSLQALVHVDEGAWSVSEAGIGPTDVWWDGIWYRHAVSCSLFPGFDCPAVTTPAPGTAGRKDIINAIRAQGLDAAVHGQANELVVSWMRSGGDYAFVTATVRKPGGGEIDWTDSEYADLLAEGLFDGPHLTAFAQKTATGWKVHELDIGATDVSWFGAWERFTSVPCALFPIASCPVSE